MRFWVNAQIAANSCTPECTILIQQACSFAELQRTCKSRIPHFHSKEAKLLMHNYSSTKWSYTCYPTFSKTNRNEHTKKESIKKKESPVHALSFQTTSISPDIAVSAQIHNLSAVKTRVTSHKKHPLHIQIMSKWKPLMKLMTCTVLTTKNNAGKTI